MGRRRYSEGIGGKPKFATGAKSSAAFHEAGLQIGRKFFPIREGAG